MKDAKLSICYHPTMTVLVDDNKQFLEATAAELLSENITSYYYDDSKSAQYFLTDVYRSNPFVNRCVSNVEESVADHLTFDFDYRKIHHEIYNAQRFAEITSLVADYSMPVLDGLEFCRSIQDENIGKVLLTGEAGKDLAVDAFNEGIIDKFIMKSAHDVLEILTESVEKLRKKYFLKFSELALRRLTNGTLACLQDPAFVELFGKLRIQHNIIEYYLLDEHGSFLLLDMKANPYWLIVKSDKEIQSLYHYALESEQVPDEIVESLKTRKMIPYFHTDEDFQTAPAQWQKYMHAASKLDGIQTYYYSFLINPAIYPLDTAKIFSYRQYIQNLYK